MISGSWLIAALLLALSAAAPTATVSQQQQQQTSGPSSREGIASGLGDSSAASSSIAVGGSSPSSSLAAASSPPSSVAAAAAATTAIAIEKEAHHDLKNENSNSSASEKLGAREESKSELGEVIAADNGSAEKEAAATTVIAAAQRPASFLRQQQVNISTNDGRQHQSEAVAAAENENANENEEEKHRGQNEPPSRRGSAADADADALGGGLQAGRGGAAAAAAAEWLQPPESKLGRSSSPNLAAAAAGERGGGGADEKVQLERVEHNHDHHQRQRRHQQHETTEQQVTRESATAEEASLTQPKPTPASKNNNNNSRGKGPVVYTNQFVIEVEGGEEEARKLAKKHGFVYLNHILADFYHLEHRRLSKRSLNAEQDLQDDIAIRDEPQVLLLERQVLKRRVKRDFIELEPPPEQHQPRLGRAHSQIRPPNQPRPPAAQQILRPGGGGGEVGRSHAHAPLHHPQQQQQHHQGQPLTRPANQQPPPPSLRLSGPNLATASRIGATGSSHHHPIDVPGSATATNGDSLVDSLEVSASTPSAASINFAGSSTNFNGPPNQRPSIYLQNISSSGSISGSATQAPLITSVIASGNKTANQNRSTSSSNSSSVNAQAFNDPSWPLMWYLDGGAKNGFDLNVMAAWKMGYTGKGIVITILDDGLEKDHPDLQANYDPLASFDINGDDADPMPRYDVNDSNRHGTRCAGEVAAVPDNNICSIGIAYNSKVGGVRMLDGDVTDAVEARSLALNNQHIHIYSASWGPDDNGKTVDGPGELATRAFIEGVTEGRQGLGSIFVFASGNGGREHDNCNCDGYTNSIWTLSISSATENGFVPWYIEACSSTLATTYSSGSYEERQIATTDLHHSCTSSHTGTSASAPLAAGICALVLESNPRLSWRDMQHIVVRTAKPANLVAKDWRTNALGRNVSHAFGYGLMDAAAMILMAKQWTSVPTQYTCEIRLPQMERPILGRNKTEVKLSAQCANVSHLEHVQSKVTLSAPRRGDLHIYLVSPGGTRSTLLATRPNDHNDQGFRNWPFMTVHNWGESPNGIWTLEVRNDGSPQTRAFLKEWTLILYGTREDPNRHLDPVAPAANVDLPPPPPPPPKRPQQQPASTAPPAPISMNPPQLRPAEPVVNKAAPDQAAPPPQQHWSAYSPASVASQPPPPLPPLAPPPTSTLATSTSASSSSSSSTTQASYVTTFNTLVSSRPPQHQQQPSMKADFDIVSPASERPPSSIGGASGSQVDDPPTTTLAEEQQPKQTINRPSSSSDTSGEEPNITKPPVESINDQQQTHYQSTGRPAGPTANNNGLGLGLGLDLEGTNQIDLKLTKDYRSSGSGSGSGSDQSLSSLSVDSQNRGHVQAPASQLDGSAGEQETTGEKSSKQKSSSSAMSSDVGGFSLVLPAALLLLGMHHQLDQLVRHSINVI